MLFMGKSTISTGPFSIANCEFTRGYAVQECISKLGDLASELGPHQQRSWEMDPSRGCVRGLLEESERRDCQEQPLQKGVVNLG